MFFLKQSTAATVRIGPFLDDSDGKTAETGLTIAQADVRLSKGGGAFAQKNDATSCTHDENGYYACPLNTTDTGSAGTLLLAVQVSGALPVWHEFMVLPANVYDSLIAASDNLQVDTVQIEGSDATDQVRDAVVDDATRIDASALNTLSGHDPGATISSFDASSDTVTVGTNNDKTGYTLDAAYDAAKSAASAADVNAQVLDVLSVDTFSELTSVPAANAPLSDKIGWLFALARNKITQTSSTTTLRNDADDADIASAAISDNGATFTRGEFS